jgi:hypothetical protein
MRPTRELKFVLPAATILIGSVFVLLDKLDGTVWSGMSTTLVTGFYALQGWQDRREKKDE